MAWSDPGYEAVIRLIHECAGLVFSPARRASVENTVYRAMARAGIRDSTHFAQLLETEVELRNSLIGELTIGESYFFRDPGQFALIEKVIVPDLLERRQAGRPLRIWSAGCACGEEPYSLAILLNRLGLAGRSRILATEISFARLEAARRAHYGRWSLRGVSPEVIAANFMKHGRSYELVPEVRGAVEFRWLNLAEGSYPAPDAGIASMDLILCRNVLIYFDMETVAAVAARLLASLADDGWLLLSAADPPLAELVPCAAELTPHGIAYRRPEQGPAVERWPRRSLDGRAGTGNGMLPGKSAPADSSSTKLSSDGVRFGAAMVDAGADTAGVDARPGAAAARPDAEWPDPGGDVGWSAHGLDLTVESETDRVAGSDAADAAVAPDEELRSAYLRGDYVKVAELAARAIEGGDDGATYWIAWVRALANQGRFEEAGRVCARALDRHRLRDELALLHAVLLAQAGRLREAAAAARRALYLDRGLIMAHVTLAQVLVRLGERDAALHALRNAHGLLALLPEDAVVPGADDERAGALLGWVRAHMHLLGREA